MAKKRFLTGILATALVFGLVLTGCENDTTDEGGGEREGAGQF
jgi:hypothetical protein